MKYKKKPKKEYVLYQGDNILSIGTIKEIAEELGIKKESVAFYRTPTYKKRTSEEKGRRLVEMEAD